MEFLWGFTLNTWSLNKWQPIRYSYRILGALVVGYKRGFSRFVELFMRAIKDFLQNSLKRLQGRTFVEFFKFLFGVSTNTWRLNKWQRNTEFLNPFFELHKDYRGFLQNSSNFWKTMKRNFPVLKGVFFYKFSKFSFVAIKEVFYKVLPCFLYKSILVHGIWRQIYIFGAFEKDYDGGFLMNINWYFGESSWRLFNEEFLQNTRSPIKGPILKALYRNYAVPIFIGILKPCVRNIKK